MEAYWWIVYLAAAVALGVAYKLLPQHRDPVVFLAAALAGAGAMGQLHAQILQNRDAVQHQRVVASFDYMKELGGEPFGQVRSKAGDALRAVKGKPAKEADEYLNAHPNDKEAVLTVFNKFEEIAIAVRTDYADEGVLCQYVSEPAVRYFQTLRPWLEYFRSTQGKGGAAEHYQWLYERWIKGCPARSLRK